MHSANMFPADDELEQIFSERKLNKLDEKNALMPESPFPSPLEPIHPGLLLGVAAVSRKNVKYLTRRKWIYQGVQRRGLNSCAIDAYLYLCLQADGNGHISNFNRLELVEKRICSDRTTYDTLKELEECGLIKINGKMFQHFKSIQLLNYQIRSKERFLNLNRSFFVPGYDDYERFKSLSVGPKCLLLHVLYHEERQEDRAGNSYEVYVARLARQLGVQKQTVIRYIKQINETFLRTVIVSKESVEASGEIRSLFSITSSTYDKRLKYDKLYFSADDLRITQIKNQALGFWRKFDYWMETHSFKERVIRSCRLYDESTHPADDVLLKENRKNFFNTIYHYLIEICLPVKDIYKVVLHHISEKGYLDELSISAIANDLHYMELIT